MAGIPGDGKFSGTGKFNFWWVALLCVLAHPLLAQNPAPAPLAENRQGTDTVAEGQAENHPATGIPVNADRSQSLMKDYSDTAALELPKRIIIGSKPVNPAVGIDKQFLRKLPGAMNDPVRGLGTTPGVTVQNDLNIRPYVRGGDADQTRVVLDGIPLLQPYHVGGAFSIFNMSTLESAELYRDDFPVEYPGALSGVLRLKTNGRMATQPHATANISMVRGDLYAEAPLLNQSLTVFGAAQSFLFRRTLHGLLDLSGAASGDSSFKADMNGYRDHINMPDFQDWNWGASFTPGDRFHAEYLGGSSGDDYLVVVPRQSNILSHLNPNFGDPSSAPSTPLLAAPPAPPRHTDKLSVDSISSVNIGNQTHFVKMEWQPDERRFIENDFAYQAQDWSVGFKPSASGPSIWSLQQSMRTFNYRTESEFIASDDNRFKAGLSYDYTWHSYNMQMPYVLYDLIVNGNMDMLEPLGNFYDQGFTIPKDDSARSNLDYLGDYPARIRFVHQGVLESHTTGIFFSHTWKSGAGTLTYGMRGEYQSGSGEFFPAPRAEYLVKPDTANAYRFLAGLYSQGDLPFYERDQNPSLRSEKSAQLGLQWTHRFTPGYRLTWDGYYKRYYDLVSPTLVSALDGSPLPASVEDLAQENYSQLAFEYANTGTGTSLGSELALYYSPNPSWTGWASADLSLSNRQDAPGKSVYAYRYHRPMVFNWVNTFAMKGGYEIGLGYRWALGQPYTTYSGIGDGRGSFDPIEVGARNEGQLAPYSRLDLRLTRQAHWWRRDYKAYIEVWNAMNSPNYFERDATTGELKAAQLNWPFPLFFVGVSGEI